jgi:hypothetical protein
VFMVSMGGSKGTIGDEASSSLDITLYDRYTCVCVKADVSVYRSRTNGKRAAVTPDSPS